MSDRCHRCGGKLSSCRKVPMNLVLVHHNESCPSAPPLQHARRGARKAREARRWTR